MSDDALVWLNTDIYASKKGQDYEAQCDSGDLTWWSTIKDFFFNWLKIVNFDVNTEPNNSDN